MSRLTPEREAEIRSRDEEIVPAYRTGIFAERSELLAELEALRAESDGLRRFNNVNLDAAKARLIENDKLRAELAARHTEIAGYKSAITINVENIRDRVAERDVARADIANVLENFDNMKDSRDAAKLEGNRLIKELSADNHGCSECGRDVGLEHLAGRAGLCREHADKLRAELAEANQECDGRLTDCNRLDAALTQTRAELGELQRDRDDLARQAEGAAEVNRQLDADLASVTADRDASDSEVDKLDTYLAEAKAQVAELVEASEKLTRAIGDMDVGMVADVATDKLIAMTRAYRKAEAAKEPR